MTHDEHIARAMLMGMEYDWRDGTYFNGIGTSGMLDCITLKGISRGAAEQRSVVKYSEVPFHADRWEYAGTLPWETDDDPAT